jgi:hypothetical protein
MSNDDKCSFPTTDGQKEDPNDSFNFMTTRMMTVLVFLILTVSKVYSQNYEPLDLARKIFDKNNLPNIKNYISGEYEGIPNGKDLPKGAVTKFILLEQTQKTAVVGMTVLDSAGKGIDTYLHFQKDTVWKMNAFRALAMTGMLEQVVIELEKITAQQLDDLITNSKSKKKNGRSVFTSREDYNFQLGNAKLTLELDENIAKHFLENRAEFERIKNLALAELEKNKADENRNIKLIESIKPEYQKLFITSISSGDYNLRNCVNFLIGGMVDNLVGYFYVKDKNDLPKMNPSQIIMIREIGNGWYIYKTT